MLTKYRTPKYIAIRKREYAMLMTQFHRARIFGVRFLAGTDVTIPYTFPGFLDVCGVILGNSFFYALVTFAAWRGTRAVLNRNRVTAMNLESRPDPNEDDL